MNKKEKDLLKMFKGDPEFQAKIENKLKFQKQTKDYVPTTIKELMKMTPKELKELKIFAFDEYGADYLFKGIKKIEFTLEKDAVKEKDKQYSVSFDGYNAGWLTLNEKIDDIGDGEPNWGIYKPKKL